MIAPGAAGPWLNLNAVQSRLRTAFLAHRLLYLTSTTSSQEVARREAEEGAPAGTIVIAEEQTAGRGRFGRTWVSPAGKNLYVTLILRPPRQRLRSLSTVSPLAVLLGVEDVTGLAPALKWPNDVVAGGRKLAGVLVETDLSGEDVRYSLVGIGLNVNMDVEPDSPIAEVATSLKRELGREVSREDLLAALLNRYESLYEEAASGTTVHDAWKARLETLGRQVRVTFRDQVFEGLAEDVDAEGSLVLRQADGSRITLDAGEVTLRPPA